MDKQPRIGRLSLVVATIVTMIVGGASSADAAVTTRLVEPSATGAGITEETDSIFYHRVVEPDGPRGRPLVVVIGGTNSQPAHYDDFTAHAAELGYPAVNIRYPNAFTVASVCQPTEASDRCYAQIRGEIVFGADVPDPNGESYASDGATVDAANSISGRLIALIDHLAADDDYWNRFLIDDASSPYVATNRGPVRLDHTQLILTGHSQGGGHAAFLAMRTPVERVVMLGSPDDTAQFGQAPWISDTSATALDRFWGIRHQSEGPFGQNVPQAWNELGGGGIGAGDDTSEADVGDGSGDPNRSHRLVLNIEQGSALLNHLSMAIDDFYLAGVPAAWTYVLTSIPGCDQTIDGVVADQLIVRQGLTCLVDGANVRDELIVRNGASVYVEGALLRGGVIVNDAGSVTIRRSTVSHGIEVVRAVGAVELRNNVVLGNIELRQNSGPTVTVSGNAMTGRVACWSNDVVPTAGDDVNYTGAPNRGQCASMDRQPLGDLAPLHNVVPGSWL